VYVEEIEGGGQPSVMLLGGITSRTFFEVLNAKSHIFVSKFTQQAEAFPHLEM